MWSEICCMKIYIAGTEHKRFVLDDVANLRPYILVSFYMVEKKLGIMNYCNDYLLDSGAFTFMNSGGHEDWEEYIERYADFINKNNVPKFFELDIDSIVGYDRVKELRKRLERLTNRQCIPVWHILRGKEEFTRMSQEYSYVAIGGIVTKEITPNKYKFFPYFIKEAHKNGAKIHALGFTNIELLKQYHFDSVDSTSWGGGGRFGYVYKFTGNSLIKKRISGGNTGMRISDYRKIDKLNFLEWVKYQKYAEGHL